MMTEPASGSEPPATALLIVDVQKGFINDFTKHVVGRVEELQTRYEHIFAARFINEVDSPYRMLLDWNRFGEGSRDVELAFRVSPQADIFDKTSYTCVSPEFLDNLRTRAISEVHLCGIDTDVCVMKSAVDLFENGIRPVVLSKASASTAGEEHHQWALLMLRRQIGARQIQ